MFGSFRFVLASMVAISHLGITVYTKNPGVVAVVSFYLLSGYVMTGLIRRYYISHAHLFTFYLDRLSRILPQYFFILLLGLILLHFFSINSSFLQHDLSLTALLENITIIPLNYFMFNQSDQMILIPPAWSLGVELQFYALIPFVLWSKKRLRLILGVISLLMFLLASIDIIQSEWYGYRLLPGVLFIFLSGSLLYDANQQHRASLYILGCLYLSVTLCFVIVCLYFNKQYPYIFEVCVGFLLALPITWMLSRFQRKEWDEYLGHLSYGVFLAHFLIIWLAQCFDINMSQYPLILVIGATALACIGHELVEKPAFAYRKKLRKKQHV